MDLLTYLLEEKGADFAQKFPPTEYVCLEKKKTICSENEHHLVKL